MGRYIGPKNKIARRFGLNLGLKTNPAKVARRLTQPPGVHGSNRRPKSLSSFGKQLIEKQKAKFLYGLREAQLRRLVTEATRKKGDSGVMLLTMLEMRLDNVVYRLGFAKTRAQARQFVSHGMFLVNGKNMNIPSHQVRSGDVISLKKNKEKKGPFAALDEATAGYELPSWLSFDVAAKSGTVLHLPTDKDFEKMFDVTLIIEFYSAR